MSRMPTKGRQKCWMAFPLAGFTIPDVEVVVKHDEITQGIWFKLPGGEVFKAPLWMILDGLTDKNGDTVHEVLKKNYSTQEVTNG